MDRPIPVLAAAVAAGVLGVSPGCLAAGVFLLLLWDRRRPGGPGVKSLRPALAALALVVIGAASGRALARMEAGRSERLSVESAWMDGTERGYSGTLLEPPARTRRGWRLALRLEVLDTPAPAPAPATVHLHLTDPCPPYRTGDRLRGRARMDVWRAPANPGEYDLRGHRLARGVSGRGRCMHAPAIVGHDPAGPGPLHRGLGRLRTRIRRGLESAALTPASRGLALALVLGDSVSLPEDLRRDFVGAGMAHLLAISGLHLALGAMLALGGIRLLLLPISHRIGPRWALALPHAALIPLVILQTALAGAPPSCLRAAVMIIYLSLGRLLGRRPDAATAVALAALINLGVHPGGIREAGFQLSFAATAAILWAAGPRPDAEPRERAWFSPVAGLARVSLAAFLATAPFVSWHFGPLPLAGPLINLVAVPLASVALLPGALLLGGCAGISATVPGFLARLFDLAADLEVHVASFGADLGGIIQTVQHDAPALVLACLGGLWLLRAGLRRRGPWILLLTAGAVFLLYAATPGPQPLDFWLLDVGEGNITVLRLPCGRTLLIDGGPPGSGRRTLLPFLRTAGIRRVDDLLISHGHDDHYGGALEVYEDMGSPRIITNGSPMIHDALIRGLPQDAADAALTCPAEARWDLCGVHFSLISPGALATGLDENDRSMIVFLTAPGLGVVFTGDMGPDGWSIAAPRLPRRRVSLLQVPHHGHAAPHLNPLLSALNPLISFAFSDGSPKNGGNPDVRRIASLHSSQYHISGLHGSLHVQASFPTLLFEPWREPGGSP